MSKPLDFNKEKKSYWTVILPDEDRTTLMIASPTKRMIDDFNAIAINDVDDASEDTLSELYNACARMMSRNKAGKIITAEMIEDLFDIEDVVIFVNNYMDFAHEITQRKN